MTQVCNTIPKNNITNLIINENTRLICLLQSGFNIESIFLSTIFPKSTCITEVLDQAPNNLQPNQH